MGKIEVPLGSLGKLGRLRVPCGGLGFLGEALGSFGRIGVPRGSLGFYGEAGGFLGFLGILGFLRIPWVLSSLCFSESLNFITKCCEQAFFAHWSPPLPRPV